MLQNFFILRKKIIYLSNGNVNPSKYEAIYFFLYT